MDQARLALHRSLGGAVWAAGDCDAAVAARFERVVPDLLPGAGPLSGIVAALDAAADRRGEGDKDAAARPGSAPPGADRAANVSDRPLDAASIVVLSGDLPFVTAGCVERLVAAAAAAPEADAVVAVAAEPRDENAPNPASAAAPRFEPCVALYRPSAAGVLRPALVAGRTPSLQSLLARLRVAPVALDAALLRGANRPEDLRGTS